MDLVNLLKVYLCWYTMQYNFLVAQVQDSSMKAWNDFVNKDGDGNSIIYMVLRDLIKIIEKILKTSTCPYTYYMNLKTDQSGAS